MSPDDIDDLVLDLHDFLVALARVPDDNDDFAALWDLVHNYLDKFCTRDRNYN